MSVENSLLTVVAQEAARNFARLAQTGLDNDLLEAIRLAYLKAVPSEEDRQRDLLALATAGPDALREAVRRVLTSVAADLSEDEKARLGLFLEQIGDLKRVFSMLDQDKTATGEVFILEASDLAELLPRRMPRFKPGDRPLRDVDLELVELLGSGGFGEVWKARNPTLKNHPQVALKFCLSTQASENLLSYEARLTDLLMRADRHPGIVGLRQTYLKSDPPCLELEFVEGVPLGLHVRDLHAAGKATPVRITRMIQGLAQIVGYAHGFSPAVVHRDLKPGNILVVDEGKGLCRVLDFGIGGIAARANTASTPSYLTGQTILLGAHSMNYAPPQQIKGARADPRDDVYALGVLWHQCLTNDFRSPAPTGAWQTRLRERGMSAGVIDLLGACVSQRVEDRPRDGSELARRIEETLAKKRWKSRPMLAMLLMVPLVLGLIWQLSPPPSPPPGPEPGPEPPPKEKTKEIPPPKKESPKPQPAVEIENSIKMKLRYVEPGKFRMGSPAEERESIRKMLALPAMPNWLLAEGPQHEVEITKGFYIGLYEVTQGEWREIMGNNPSCFSATGDGKDKVRGVNTSRFPVDQVSWEDAKQFIAALNARKREKVRHRLPTEAEWEYACREGAGGKTTTFHQGDSLSSKQANFNGEYPFGGAEKGPFLGRTCQVGTYPTNALKLHDMHGNVSEWCEDAFTESVYKAETRRDPVVGGKNRNRVLRGGNWHVIGRDCRSASRNGDDQAVRHKFVGLRVVGELKEQ